MLSRTMPRRSLQGDPRSWPSENARRSRADDGQDLVAAALHLGPRRRLDIQAHQRIVRGGANVEVPVRILYRDAVAEILRAAGISRLDPLDHGAGIRHGRVDLTRDMVSPEVGDERAERLAGIGEHLEDREKWDV